MIKRLFFVLLCLTAISTFAQTTVKKSADNFIDSLKQNKIDRIIEIRINADNQGHLIHFPSTYIYFKNNSKFHFQYCGKRFGKSTSKTECNDNWQSIFDFISEHLDSLKHEIFLSDTVILSDGTIKISSPDYYDVVEVIVHFKEKAEKITIRTDYFLPSENRNYKKNILTKTYLFLTLIEKCNDEIDKKNNY